MTKTSSPDDKYAQYFRTDHLQSDLKGRSVRGGFITLFAQAVKFCSSLASNIVLARLLNPEDYGLVGMVATITVFISFFKDLGLSTATIQKDEITHEQVSTLFWVNLALGVVTTVIVVAIAPIAVWFYQEPRLFWITVVTASGFVISSLGVQHSALMNRQMQFRALTIIDILATVVGLLSGVVGALFGLGYWALVIYPLVTAGFYTISYWVACSWRPGWLIRGKGILSMLVFGGHLTGFNLVNYFARNLDNVLIGKVWGAQQLGLYAKAYQLLLLPINQLNQPITKVAIPALSRLQHNPQKFRQYYLTALTLLAFLTTPIIFLMILLSKEIIELFLGSQWREATSIFQLLAISAVVQPICNTTGWIYISTNRTKQMLNWGIPASAFIVISFFIGLSNGAEGVAFCYAIAMLLQAPPCIYFATRQTSITLMDTWYVLHEVFLSSLVAGLATYTVKIAIGSLLPTWMVVVLCSSTMFLIHVTITFYLFKKKKFYLSVIDKLRQK